MAAPAQPLGIARLTFVWDERGLSPAKADDVLFFNFRLPWQISFTSIPVEQSLKVKGSSSVVHTMFASVEAIGKISLTATLADKSVIDVPLRVSGCLSGVPHAQVRLVHQGETLKATLVNADTPQDVVEATFETFKERISKEVTEELVEILVTFIVLNEIEDYDRDDIEKVFNSSIKALSDRSFQALLELEEKLSTSPERHRELFMIKKIQVIGKGNLIAILQKTLEKILSTSDPTDKVGRIEAIIDCFLSFVNTKYYFGF